MLTSLRRVTMIVYLWIVPFLGLTALIGFLFVALQRWTAMKQQQ